MAKGVGRVDKASIDVTAGAVDWNRILDMVVEEFRNFHPPAGYKGGRHQTHVRYVFAHIRGDGSLGRIEVEKPGGSRFYLAPE